MRTFDEKLGAAHLILFRYAGHPKEQPAIIKARDYNSTSPPFGNLFPSSPKPIPEYGTSNLRMIRGGLDFPWSSIADNLFSNIMYMEPPEGCHFKTKIVTSENDAEKIDLLDINDHLFSSDKTNPHECP